MIDHISIPVRDLETSAKFYQHVLEPLGYKRLVDDAATVGFGFKYPEFWLNARSAMQPIEAHTGAHVCLRAKTIEAVNSFHERAIGCGGTDDGRPGPRQGAMVVYYGAFIRDPDGNRIEVMTVPASSAST